MRRLSAILVPACVVAIAPAIAHADVTMPGIFNDHMVLQREAAPAIWGWETPGVTVRVSTSWGASVETVADDRGRWRVTVSTKGVDAGPHDVRVDGQTSMRFDDVLVGEVWVCSGQSNMEWPIHRTLTDAATVGDEQIRLFMIPNTIAAQPRLDCGGEWAACTPATARNFSAVGYHFARNLRAELGVPVGLISSDWGGTKVEAWMSGDAAQSFPQLASDLQYLRDVSDPNRRVKFVEGRMEKWWEGLDTALGLDGSWRTPDYDDSSWDATNLPETWGGDLGNFDGVVWYRRTMELAGAWDGAPAMLELGPIDDNDDVWVNGTHVGGMHDGNAWNQPRRYVVPPNVLRAGVNIIAVRVLDTGGLGGINGNASEMKLRRTDKAGSLNMHGPWRRKQGPPVSKLPARPRGAALNPNISTVLHNGMIAPIAGYGIRGALWYQGESNRMAAGSYRAMLSTMIEDWRRVWNIGEFPFYYVQIAPYNYGRDTGQAARLREAQLQTMSTPNTGMAVTLDIGNPTDIHPVNKRDVGDRLALWAFAKTYGKKGIVYSGPQYTSMTTKGTKAVLHFDHVGGGLELRGDASGLFMIAGADKVWHEASAEVDGETITVWSGKVQRPVAVRYAFIPAPSGVLFNRAGLPASSFRTDAWEN